MTISLTIQCAYHITRHGYGARKEMKAGQQHTQVSTEPGRVPRISRLMALALRLDKLLRSGELRSCAQIAELGHVTRARVCQILNLLNLAPDIQEAILLLPCTLRGRDPIIMRDLQPIASLPDWRQQRRGWESIRRQVSRS